MQEIDFTINGIYHVIEFIESQNQHVDSIHCSMKNACVFVKMNYTYFDYNSHFEDIDFNSSLIGYIFGIPVRRNISFSNDILQFKTESGDYDFFISVPYKYPKIMILKND